MTVPRNTQNRPAKPPFNKPAPNDLQQYQLWFFLGRSRSDQKAEIHQNEFPSRHINTDESQGTEQIKISLFIFC
jgi:hypothetical protein